MATKEEKAKKETESEMEEKAADHKEDCDCAECAKKAKKSEDSDKMEEKAGTAESPSEGAASGADSNSTMSPNAGVPSSQNVAHGTSTIAGERMANNSAMSPSDVGYSGKSASNPDLMKSPLFVELSSQIDGFQKALTAKIGAIEKSMNDRLSNLQKTIAAVEQFYNKPLHKGFDENVNPEAIQAHSIKTQVEKGNVRFRQ